MYELEILLLVFWGSLTVVFIYNWYRYLFRLFKPKRKTINNLVLGLLPILILTINLITLKNLASFDVVNDGFYITFLCFYGICVDISI